MLGWVHRERGVPLEELSFSSVLPSSARAGVSTVFDYVLWLHDSRDISVRTEGLVVSCRAALMGTSSQPACGASEQQRPEEPAS